MPSTRRDRPGSPGPNTGDTRSVPPAHFGALLRDAPSCVQAAAAAAGDDELMNDGGAMDSLFVKAPRRLIFGYAL